MTGQLERDGRIADGSAAPDRRRPGRVAYTNPHLIELLRESPGPLVSPTDDNTGDVSRATDSLAAARGIGLAAVLGTLCWAVLAFGLWLLLHG
jgi:hypothetical protein